VSTNHDQWEIPSAFGGTWQAFVKNWCSGHAPGYEPAIAIKALRVLGGLWPEAIESSLRGMYYAAHQIELGMHLSQVRPYPGFEDLLARLRLKDHGARAELVVAASLISEGLPIRLGAPCESKLIDIAIDTPANPVFIEVVSPEVSMKQADEDKLVSKLRSDLGTAAQGHSILIEFSEDPTSQLVDALISAVHLDASGVWQNVNQSARFRRWPATAASSAFNIAWPGSYDRAEKIVRRKCEQLSRDVPNVIAIDMSANASSIFEWRSSVRRLLQPSKNQRIGAVALYETMYSSFLDRACRAWWIIENPYALQPIPKEVIHVFESLDETANVRNLEARLIRGS
jgi:hypothetical protein